MIVGIHHVTAEGNVETARPYEPRELICQGARPLQTQEPFPPVVMSVFVNVLFPAAAAAAASRDASPFQVFDHQLSEPVVSGDGIIYRHHNE